MPRDRRCDIGDEQVVADELAPCCRAGSVSDLPALPVVLGHAVLDGDDRIGADELGEIVDLLGDERVLPFAFIDDSRRP